MTKAKPFPPKLTVSTGKDACRRCVHFQTYSQSAGPVQGYCQAHNVRLSSYAVCSDFKR